MTEILHGPTTMRHQSGNTVVLEFQTPSEAWRFFNRYTVQAAPTRRCRACGVAYGYDRIVPHRAGCSLAKSAGVCLVDCD